MNRPELPKKRIVAALIVGLAAGAALGGYHAVTANRLSAFGDEFWGKAGQVCDGVGISEAPVHIQGSEPQRVVGVDLGAKLWWSGTRSIPEAWWPTALQDLDLVLCTGPEEEIVIQTCSYESGITKTHVQYKRHVVLREARTAAIVGGAETDLKGSMPGDCPDRTSSGGTIGGGIVGEAQVAVWLGPYVSR